MRILYVEDDSSMARIVEKILRQCGYRHDTVDCGEDAVDRASRHDYDLILLDIMLPDIDGYEVIARLRRKGVDTPFLVQTGLVDRDHGAGDGVSLGVTDFLVKPFNRAELIAGIENVVGRTRQVGELTRGPVAADTRGRDVAKGERRRHRRFFSERYASVTWPYVFQCRILDMSHGGAALRLPHPMRELSGRFRLSVGFGPALDCQVCWRANDKVGVKFV